MSTEIALDNLNEMYNYVMSGDYGKISLNELRDLAACIFPEQMRSPAHLEKVFNTFKEVHKVATAAKQGDGISGQVDLD